MEIINIEFRDNFVSFDAKKFAEQVMKDFPELFGIMPSPSCTPSEEFICGPIEPRESRIFYLPPIGGI